MEESNKEKILGTIMFIRSVTERELAEFIVDQSNAINGLNKNNRLFIKAFYNNSLNPDVIQATPDHTG